jgi:hypothetical protein
VSADMLGGMPKEVEVGSPALFPAADTVPAKSWFADATALAGKVPGTGVLTVAALGPTPAPGAVAGKPVTARAYELRRGRDRYVGSVVEVAGRTVCASVAPAGPARAAVALRCPVPGGTAGVVHLVGGPGVRSVDVALAATPAPAGQRPYAASADRPAGTPAGASFAVLEVVPAGFPCGAGTLTAHRGSGEERQPLDVYRP